MAFRDGNSMVLGLGVLVKPKLEWDLPGLSHRTLPLHFGDNLGGGGGTPRPEGIVGCRRMCCQEFPYMFLGREAKDRSSIVDHKIRTGNLQCSSSSPTNFVPKWVKVYRIALCSLPALATGSRWV